MRLLFLLLLAAAAASSPAVVIPLAPTTPIAVFFRLV